MPDPLEDDPSAVLTALGQVMEAAERYLPTVPTRPATTGRSALEAARALEQLSGPGVGATAAVATLIDAALAGATTSTGPRYLDFVVGGATPAAMAADWLTALIDQNAAGPGSSTWATELEASVLRRLVALFGLPPSWSGVLTTSSMLASFTGLACATGWWGARQGVDVAEDGLAGLPPLPVFASALVHPTTRKALQMLGHGRRCVNACLDGADGRIDLDQLERGMRQQGGAAVVIATAGDAGAGRFDPLAEMAALAERHGAWLHVDGAFGLYAALSPRSRHLLEGLERADSVAADAHKWMNVPYESGFCLLRDPALLEPTFGMPAAAYLPGLAEGFRGFSVLGPESSRRARALPIWASIAAYGTYGLAHMVERHLDAAAHLAARVRDEPELELVLAPVSCVVCFRWTAGEPRAEGLDEQNRRLARALADDGRFALGTTVVEGVVALRAALCNWRVRPADLDDLVHHVLQTARVLSAPPL